MEKNEILMIYGKNYKEMTKELLTAANLSEQIGDKKKKIGLKPNLVVAKTPDSGATTHTDTETVKTHADYETEATHTDTETEKAHEDTETTATHTDTKTFGDVTNTTDERTDVTTIKTHTDTKTRTKVILISPDMIPISSCFAFICALPFAKESDKLNRDNKSPISFAIPSISCVS